MGIPTGWPTTVSLNGLTLSWDERNQWYDGGAFVQPAYGGPVWLAEYNDGDRLQQQYFTPNPDGTVTWLAPVICFFPWGAPAGMPTGGMYLQGSSGLSFGWKSGRVFPADLPVTPDGPLTTYAGGFVPSTPDPDLTTSGGFGPDNGFTAENGFLAKNGFTMHNGF